MTLKIGEIEYANCYPLFQALKSNSKVQNHIFVKGVPSELNKKLFDNEIDICISSSIVYAIASEKFLVVPGLSISAKNRVDSVILFSRVPMESLDNATIGLTTESDTSVALLKIILSKKFGFVNKFERTTATFPDALKEFPALLLIGDSALKAGLSKTSYHVYDLGELWHQFTQLPFVFALWIVNRSSVLLRKSAVDELAHTLHESKEISANLIDKYAEEALKYDWLSTPALVSYWKTISYDLGEPEIKGLMKFYSLAAELGIVKKCPELNFLPGFY